ncbi:MAG: hypothetical protein Q8M24_20965 [Pseudolabrys sp.]|nr:hypothetical protein [Pseudolabrys sp.]MDP2297922.1 hypothetical protein [Pseudolabrys sp.]
MADWSVKIAVVNGKTVFQPQLQSGGTNVLFMSPGDSCSWNNTTSQQVQPWPADANFQPLPDNEVVRGTSSYLSDPIAPDHSSRPSWIAPGSPVPNTVNYIAKGHSDVQGVLSVANPPPPSS